MHTRGVTEGDDFVDSPADDVIIQTIRKRYLQDASLAIVLLGESTWSRRFVDWEIAAAIGSERSEPLALMPIGLGRHSALPPRLRPIVAPDRGRRATVARVPKNVVGLSANIACSLRRRQQQPPAVVAPLLRHDLPAGSLLRQRAAG